MAHKFFGNDQFNFETQNALGAVIRGCGDTGEIFTTVDRIRDGDAESWCREWTATADRVGAIAEACAARGHHVSARAAHLRASVYFAMALSAVDGTADPSATLKRTFRAHRSHFTAYSELLSPPGESVNIPYEGTTLPGFLFRPDPTWLPRPTLILNNGSDGAITSLWPSLGIGGTERGYNVLVFDGPGQQSMLFEHGIPFRYDWEKVITPIVDFLSARPEVDPKRIALYGISQAGYWVPRALAFENRIAAGIADPGVFDVASSWMPFLDAQLRQYLQAGNKAAFDQYMQEGMRQATSEQRQTLSWRAKPYGKSSYYDVLAEVSRYNLAPVVDRILTPMFIADPEGEQFWPGQSRQLYDALPGPKALVPFSAAEGADRHCEPMARSLLEQRMFDWLDETL